MNGQTRKQFEQRRLRAGRLLLKGLRQADVAMRVGVSRESVRRWAQRFDEGGLPALKNASRLGRPSGLGELQRRQLLQALRLGAINHGFASDQWTLRRAAQLIEGLFGRCYSPAQVSRILKSLDWTRASSERPAPPPGGTVSRRAVRKR